MPLRKDNCNSSNEDSTLGRNCIQGAQLKICQVSTLECNSYIFSDTKVKVRYSVESYKARRLQFYARVYWDVYDRRYPLANHFAYIFDTQVINGSVSFYLLKSENFRSNR